MTLQSRPRYGNAGGSGRRISDLEEMPLDDVTKGLRDTARGVGQAGLKPVKAARAKVDDALWARKHRKYMSELPDTIGKARQYDPEIDRARRYGAAEAALAGAGAVAGFRGVKGAAKTTKLLRGTHRNIVGSPAELKAIQNRTGKAVGASRKDLAYLGGGAAGVGGAVALNRHAESRRSKPWN